MARESRIESFTRKEARSEKAVQILDNLFGPSVDRLQQSMSLATRRHQALTNNLANVNTPGYKRQDVDFNLHLDDELSKAGGHVDHASTQTRTDQNSLRLDGNNVDLEREVMSLAETELRYQALTDMTASYFAGMKNIIREGR